MPVISWTSTRSGDQTQTRRWWLSPGGRGRTSYCPSYRPAADDLIPDPRSILSLTLPRSTQPPHTCRLFFTPFFIHTLFFWHSLPLPTDTFYLPWVNILGRTAFRLDWSLMDVSSEESLPNVLTAMFVCLFPFRRRIGGSSCNNVLPFISLRQEMHVYTLNIVDSLASICNLLRN